MMTIALPTGKLYKKSVEILRGAGLYAEGLIEPARRLIFEGTARFILVKPADVAAYVENGAADIGIVGSDVLNETRRDVCELFDLGFGKCRLVMAAREPARELEEYNNRKVATKYPNSARDFFFERCMEMEYIKLNGSIELASVIGLAHCIVDIVETGTTLRENGLVEVATIEECSARLIANRVSYKFSYRHDINALIERLT